MENKFKKTVAYLTGAEEYITRIRSKYDTLCDSERQVADFFLGREGVIYSDLNIQKISKQTRTSIATVVRFCKSLGFKGFSEFKYFVAKGILTPVGGNVKIGSRDGMGLVKQKVAEYATQKIHASMQHTDNAELERAVDALENCGKMIICASGTSSGVAMSVAHIFMIMGIPCYTASDSITMLRMVSFCERNDVVIGITSCGTVKMVVDALKIGRDRKATTICLTEVRESLATRYADINLYYMLADNTIPLDIINSSMCQLITLQAVQVGYLSRQSEFRTKTLKDNYALSEMSRYSLDVDRVENKRVKF